MSSWDPHELPRGEGRVICTIDGSFADIVLENTARRNAISPGMMIDLRQIAARLQAEQELSVVLLRGASGAFCAGGDLRAVRQHLLEPNAGAGMCAYMTRSLEVFARLPAVIIASLEGAALGGGAELLSICDVVYAHPSASVGYVHASLG